MILWALAGEAASEGLKNAASVAARVGSKHAGKAAMEKLPKQAFKEVNRQVWPLIGRHLTTKGPQGLLSISKVIPVLGSAVGGVAGATIDWIFCHKAIDFADQWVFKQVTKGEEQLRSLLESNGFEDLAWDLIHRHHFEVESICDATLEDLKGLGLPLGPVLKLHRWLHRPKGPCAAADRAEL